MSRGLRCEHEYHFAHNPDEHEQDNPISNLQAEYGQAKGFRLKLKRERQHGVELKQSRAVSIPDTTDGYLEITSFWE